MPWPATKQQPDCQAPLNLKLACPHPRLESLDRDRASKREDRAQALKAVHQLLLASQPPVLMPTVCVKMIIIIISSSSRSSRLNQVLRRQTTAHLILCKEEQVHVERKNPNPAAVSCCTTRFLANYDQPLVDQFDHSSRQMAKQMAKHPYTYTLRNRCDRMPNRHCCSRQVLRTSKSFLMRQVHPLKARRAKPRVLVREVD